MAVKLIDRVFVRPPTNAVPHDLTSLFDGFGLVTQERDRVAFYCPFTEVWEKFWERETILFHNPQSEGYRQFLRKGGFKILKKLAKKRSDPNFILALLVGYLWRSDVSEYEHKSHFISHRIKLLKATQLVRRNLGWLESRENINIVNRELGDMEANIEYYLSEKDFRQPGRKGHSAKDKTNRVIYCIYEHLKQRSGGPQWKLFLELLSAARVITIGIKKRERHEDEVNNSPDRRILPHIISFQKYHPKEVKQIPQLIREWFSPLPY